MDESAGEVFEEPFRELLPKFLALAKTEITQVNLPIPEIVTIALGVQPALENLKDRLARELPSVDPELPQTLRVHALALSHAETLYRMAVQTPSSLPALGEEGMKLRAVLLADARALAQRGQIDGRRLKGRRVRKGYENLAVDLQILAQLFRECPPSIRGGSAVSPEEVLRAEQIAAMLFRALGTRKKAPFVDVEAALDVRDRAFTLFVRHYDEARRAVTFLRWYQKDANELVPSLYEKHKKRASAPDSEAVH